MQECLCGNIANTPDSNYPRALDLGNCDKRLKLHCKSKTVCHSMSHIKTLFNSLTNHEFLVI